MVSGKAMNVVVGVFDKLVRTSKTGAASEPHYSAMLMLAQGKREHVVNCSKIRNEMSSKHIHRLAPAGRPGPPVWLLSREVTLLRLRAGCCKEKCRCFNLLLLQSLQPRKRKEFFLDFQRLFTKARSVKSSPSDAVKSGSQPYSCLLLPVSAAATSSVVC